MTSNVGSDFINKMSSIGFTTKYEIAERESMKDKIMESLKDQFRPEFLNRIDDVIIFNSLPSRGEPLHLLHNYIIP